MGARLIRDRADQVPWADESGKQFVRPVKDIQEFNRLVIQKLLEECGELLAADTRQAIMEEAADVYEVLRAIVSSRGVDPDWITTAALAKRDKKGGFGVEGPPKVWDV